MLTHQLSKNNQLFNVMFTNHAKRYYLKDFQKKYKGKQWDYTQKSIIQDLSRLRMENNKTQFSNQIDEFKYFNHTYLAKYDFKVALVNESSKSSGNRCVLFIDEVSDNINILMIYNKSHLPKNIDETKYVMSEVANNFSSNSIQQLIKK